MSRLIRDKYLAHQQECLARFNQLKANEEELNRIFIDIYGLQGELTPDVADKDVTVYRIIDNPNEEERKMAYVLSMRDEIVSLLSYIVGCMLGRYSPYVDGLLYAGGEWDYAAVCQRIAEGAKECDFYDDSLGLFLPDKDGIVPITDDEYFADDIVSRTLDFIRKVYGADTLDENLRFVADALGNKGDSPRDVLRNYYLKDFYTDHLRTYQKRPIYKSSLLCCLATEVFAPLQKSEEWLSRFPCVEWDHGAPAPTKAANHVRDERSIGLTVWDFRPSVLQMEHCTTSKRK